MTINSMSCTGTDEERVMHSKSDNIEVTIFNKAYEVIQELFEALLSRYQTDLKESMKGSEFVFNCINLLH